jgi:pyrimidine-nucleoside phosphorylase
MVPQWLIEKKRDGSPLSRGEISEFINGFTAGDIPEYQMAALAMAIYFQGMTFEEVTALTETMMHSGDVIDTSTIALPKVDKHSTGGIGDKVSLVLAPLVACCDVSVPMISGRGLGITGGTLDKLESIPGYRTDLDTQEFLQMLNTCGCVITGQTASLAPADRKLYALRDVTGTVPSIPLISASIMSKKLAEGTDALVLDVKWGKGAFMKSVDQARELANTMVEIGVRMGRGMTAMITDMNQPLGCSAGNSLEIIETVQTLRGEGPADLLEVTMELAAHMLLLTDRAGDKNEALQTLQKHLDSGAAFDKFKDMVAQQGGNPGSLENLSMLPTASMEVPFPSPQEGYVADVDAEDIGKACLVLGAGRVKVTDHVDPAVGVSKLVKCGERVEKDQALALVHGNDAGRMEEAMQHITRAFDITAEVPNENPLIVETISPRK